MAVNGNCSGSYPLVGFDASSVEPSGTATTTTLELLGKHVVWIGVELNWLRIVPNRGLWY